MASNSLIEILSDILKTANAGYNFDNNGEIIPEENWVKPWENQGTPVKNYSQVRGDDKIVSVLNNSSKLQYTNLYDNFIRLLMPKYSRRVEVEDLNRNFWVIAQTLAAVCQYLLRATNVHREVLLLPSDEFHTCVKYDAFDTFPSISASTIADTETLEQVIFDRLDFLKKTYPNSDLVIIPVIRQDNYYHNYYKKEIYLGVYKYNKFTNTDTFDWFYNTNGEISPIISSSQGKEDKIFYLNEDQIDLHFYWYFGNSTYQETSEDHSRAYVNAFRTTPTFENEDSTEIKIIIEDAIGIAIKNAIGISKVYKETYTINYINNKYVWTKTTEESDIGDRQKYGQITMESKVKGYYLGELSSDRGKFISGTIDNYNLDIVTHNLRPISPSYYEIYYILNNLHKITNTRGSTPDIGTASSPKTRKKFLPTNGAGSISEKDRAINFYQLLNVPIEVGQQSEQYVPYGTGKDNNNYQTYKNVNGKDTLTQHGEDVAALELYKEELQQQGTDKIILHLFNHSLLLQKAEGGTAENKNDKLKNVITVHKDNNGFYAIEKNPNDNTKFLDDYIVYEYDGYLTGTSQNTSNKTAQAGFKSGMGDGAVNTTIDKATPRRDHLNGSYFETNGIWESKGTPLETIVIDNGEIASAPDSHASSSESKPRFSNGLEEYTYGAILQIPYKTNRSLCYNFEYNLFENALQDSSVFWRGAFEIKVQRIPLATGVNPIYEIYYTVGNENYGRMHKIYTNAQYFTNTGNSKDMIIKITNVGITFGPELRYYQNNTNGTSNLIQFSDLPNEYKYGHKTEESNTITDYDNWLVFDKTKRESSYYNSLHQPKHISPLAPIAVYGWPIRSAVDSSSNLSHWDNTNINDGSTTTGGTQPQIVTMKTKIENDITKNTTGDYSITYVPLLTKPRVFTKRGFTASALPAGNSTTMKLPSQIVNAIAEFKNQFETQPNPKESISLDFFVKDENTLNEGKYYQGCGQSKYYGFTTLVHTVYLKVDLSDDSIPCQVATCIAKRLNIDYRPNKDSDSNRLLWNKKWTSNIDDITTQADMENLISNSYSLDGITGDFVNEVRNEQDEIVEQKLIYDFAKYPSNGMCNVYHVDPDDFYSRGNGDLTPTNTPNTVLKDMNITVTVPDGNEHWGADTISTFQENLVLTEDTLTGTSKYVGDTKEKDHYIILDYVATDIETGTQIATGQIHFSDCDEPTWDRTIPITVTHSDYVTTTKTITVSDLYEFEPAPSVEENTPSEENPE